MLWFWKKCGVLNVCVKRILCWARTQITWCVCHLNLMRFEYLSCQCAVRRVRKIQIDNRFATRVRGDGSIGTSIRYTIRIIRFRIVLRIGIIIVKKWSRTTSPKPIIAKMFIKIIVRKRKTFWNVRGMIWIGLLAAGEIVEHLFKLVRGGRSEPVLDLKSKQMNNVMLVYKHCSTRPFSNAWNNAYFEALFHALRIERVEQCLFSSCSTRSIRNAWNNTCF